MKIYIYTKIVSNVRKNYNVICSKAVTDHHTLNMLLLHYFVK